MTTTDVYDIPGCRASAAISFIKANVFREDGDHQTPVELSPQKRYMRWGVDNRLPYNVLDLVEKDETLQTCMQFQSEVFYGAGLRFVGDMSRTTAESVRRFCDYNDLDTYWLGVAQDLKHWGFAVTIFTLDDKGDIAHIMRQPAIYCRFAPADANGKIPYLLVGNWRSNPSANEVTRIELLDPRNPLGSFEEMRARNPRLRTFAEVVKISTPDQTYYPIPYYASIFRSGWYDIKQLIGVAKRAKLRNSAPIKYHVEISDKYLERVVRREHITDPAKQIERVNKLKSEIIDFLTNAENSGKTLFSQFYVDPSGHECHDITIKRIDVSKEGGDWESDIQEAINMICFTMRTHSNLVGSVPGKAQSNNSGSDKRELYTIAHALQKPYHSIALAPLRVVIAANQWEGVRVETPFVQLTTLDQHTDARVVNAQ